MFRLLTLISIRGGIFNSTEVVLYYLLTSNIFFTGVARRFGPGESDQRASGGQDYFGNLSIESF